MGMNVLTLVMDGADRFRLRQVGDLAQIVLLDLQKGRALNDPITRPVVQKFLATLESIANKQLLRMVTKNVDAHKDPHGMFAAFEENARWMLSMSYVPPRRNTCLRASASVL
jgi:hypothetical protein